MSEGNENQKQEEITSAPIQKPWRVFVIEALLFSFTLGFGIASAVRIGEVLEIQKITIPKISLWQFIIYFLLATLFIFLILRFVKFKKEKGLLLKVLFVLAIFLGGLLFIEVWLPEPVPLIIIFILIFRWWKSPSILNQDILMILGMAGAGSVLGLSLRSEIIITLLIFFSIYDFIAVYKTKHMVKMAKEMIEQKVILALIIPPNISAFKTKLEEIKPRGEFLILGGGDVIFPLLFSASLIPTGILNSIIVAIFSLFGLFTGFYIFVRQKIRQPIPALPPIAFFSIIGYLITKIL